MLRVQGNKAMSSDSVGPQKTGPSMSTGRSWILTSEHGHGPQLIHWYGTTGTPLGGGNDYRPFSNKRPGGHCIFKKGALIWGYFLIKNNLLLKPKLVSSNHLGSTGFLDLEKRVNLQGTSNPPASLQCCREVPCDCCCYSPFVFNRKLKQLRHLPRQMTTEQLLRLSEIYRGRLLEGGAFIREYTVLRSIMNNGMYLIGPNMIFTYTCVIRTSIYDVMTWRYGCDEYVM